MYHLIYISYANYPMSEAELEAILQSARKKNREMGITGMLLYLNEKFIQVLEGEQDQIEKLMNIIELDPRHKKISVLLKGNTNERIFKNWSMGFKRLGPHDFKTLSGYEDMDYFFHKVNVHNDSSPLLIFLKLFYSKNINDHPEFA